MFQGTLSIYPLQFNQVVVDYISKPELPTMRIPNSFAFSVPKIRMAIEQRAQRSVGGFGAFSIFDLFTEESLSDCKSARPSYIPWLLWWHPTQHMLGLPRYHTLAISHWSVGLLTQAPIGPHSANRIQPNWSDLILPRAFDLERNTLWQQFAVQLVHKMH